MYSVIISQIFYTLIYSKLRKCARIIKLKNCFKPCRLILKVKQKDRLRKEKIIALARRLLSCSHKPPIYLEMFQRGKSKKKKKHLEIYFIDIRCDIKSMIRCFIFIVLSFI